MTCSICSDRKIRRINQEGLIQAVRCECLKCECAGEGYVFTEVDGRGQQSECPCSGVIKLAKRINQACLPGRFMGSSLQNYSPKNQTQGAAKKQCSDFLEGDNWLLLSGPPGTGKTHLAVALAFELMGQGKKVKFFEFSSLLAEIRSGYGEDRSELDLIKPFLQADFLIFDELGKGRCTEFEQNILDLIVTALYNRALCRPIFTSNYLASASMDSPLALSSRLGQRVYSRIMGESEYVELTGDDYRQKELPEERRYQVAG